MTINYYSDVSLTKDYTDYYDISWKDGDFVKTSGLDMAIKISLMAERRASVSEVPIKELRRGWIGNLFNSYSNFEIGSKLWLLSQAKCTQETLNFAIGYAQNALQWFISDKYCSNITVKGNIINQSLLLYISFYVGTSLSGLYVYDLWANTINQLS